MSDPNTSKTVELNETRSSYNRASGKKTLTLFGILITIVVVLMVATFVLFLQPR